MASNAGAGAGRWLFWLVVCATAASSTLALADPTPQQKELARDLMQKGYAARNAHDFKLALQSFQSADEIMHVPTTAFEVARSQTDLGLLIEAHETLLSVIRMPEKPGEPQAFRDARGYAKVLDEQVVPRIAQIRISVQGAAPGHAPTVTVDGTKLPDGALLVPYKVDPGHHVVEAKSDTADGRAETDVAERETKEVGVVLAASPSAAVTPPQTASAAPSQPAASSAPEVAPPRRGGLRPLVWTGFGLAIVGMAAGTVTGIVVLHDRGTIASQCNGTRCPPSTYDELSTAGTLATVSTVSFIVAGVGAGVGLTAWLFGRGGDSASQPPSSGVRVRPYVWLGSAGVSGTF